VLGLKAKDVRSHLDSGDFFCHIENLHLDRSSAGRRHAMVGYALVDHTHEMRAAGVVELEREATFRVGLGAARFLHALTQAEEHDIVSRSRLVGGAVGDRAGERLGGDESGKKAEDDEDDSCLESQTLAPLLAPTFLAASSK